MVRCGRRRPVRHDRSLVTLTAAAIFTGFGLFVGLLIAPAVLAVEAVAADSRAR